MAKQFIPLQSQSALNYENLIVENKGGEEQVPMDVLFVGAGPAGLCGAIELAKLVKEDPSLGEVEIGVLEKAENLGGHCLSGAVINPVALKALFPELKEEDFPFRKKVSKDSVYMLSETGKIKIPTPPTMHNKDNYVASICEVVRWLGDKAEELGVNIFTSFPADSLLREGNNIVGVRTVPAGLDRNGQPGGQYMPATDVTAKVTVLSEGTRGPLGQAFTHWQKISSNRPQIFALGVKEIWRTQKVPEGVIHTLGWPLPKDCFGGSFIYPMGDDTVAVGLVAGLDYKRHNLDVHKELQRLKQHPLLKEYLEGGECIEWGAKTIPEGGYEALPEVMHGNGLILTGDTAGFVNVPALKGIHYAMQSGMFAARTAYEALKADNYSKEQLKSYDEMVHNSFIASDLKKVRNMRHAFKSGFYAGGIKAGLMTLTGGHFPGVSGKFEEDAAEVKEFSTENVENPGMSKVDAVYLAGNKTRDDIPSHLTVGPDVSKETAEFYTHLCPAGVYEMDGDKLVVNAPNCVDCKATDVLGPRWQPREGGSGPNYKQM